jgi:putative DNA methylase
MIRRLPSPSLLDLGKLPIAQLARIAVREGVRPRAAYQSHKWFARRLAVTARALLVAAAARPDEQFWPAFYRGTGWKDRSVLDPFVGGGVMLLEAARLGAKVHGVDIEPVAAAIAGFQTRLRDLPDLDATLQSLVHSAGRAVSRFYHARDAQGKKATLLHAFWVQSVRCKSCGHAIDAHPTFRFASDHSCRKQWVACKSCSSVLEANIRCAQVACSCGVTTAAAEGHVQRGEVCCPACGTRERLIDVSRRTRRPPKFRIFAVETLPQGDARRYTTKERRIRSATDFDQERYRAARRELLQLLRRHPRALPPSAIPRKRRSDNRVIEYGYTDYRELFNARQQLHLALLGAEIARLKAPVREAFAVAFSDHLTTNNMMCAYADAWRRLTPLFSIRAYRHIPRPVEINPWLRCNGRGTFPNAVRSVNRAAAALREPAEPTPEGLFRPVVDAQVGEAHVVCGDARDLAMIPSGSIDLVLTDPPYFDYISYSELGHFFAPWLARFGLIETRQSKRFPMGQLASPARSRSAERTFARKLSAAFEELRRVCRTEGRIVFTYQNLDGRGWQAIAQALANSGIVPTTTFPLYGDSSASLHKHAQSISWDCVMVCRLGRPVERLIVGSNAHAEGSRVASQWATRLAAKDLLLTEGDRTNIAHAAAIVAEFSVRTASKTRVKRTSASRAG